MGGKSSKETKGTKKEKTNKTEETKETTGAPETKGDMTKPQVVFVLGGPGSGKGTQCSKIVENNPGWSHISAGDCLRAERDNPDSKDGQFINGLISEGKLVPVEITLKLMKNVMLDQCDKGVCKFLLDGFPRNEDNIEGWNKMIGDTMNVCGILFFDLSEEVMTERLLKRGEQSGREDDNLEAIKKRFKVNLEQSLPIVEKYKEKGMVVTISSEPPMDEVYEKVKEAIDAWESKMPKL